MIQKILFLIILSIAVFSCYGQKINRNLSFEESDVNGTIISWGFISNPKYDSKLDSTVSHDGKYAMLIQSTETTDRGTIIWGSSIQDGFLAEKRIITISGFIKTENLTDGSAFIIMEITDINGKVQTITSIEQAKMGTTDWNKHTIDFRIQEKIKGIRFGFVMTGIGKAWSDDFSIKLDDMLI